MMHELPIATVAEAGLNQAALERMSHALQAEIDRGRLPGAVTLIARGGRIAWFESLGRQAPGSETLMARDSLFRIYSMTKPLVSLAIMMLVEEGRLLLGDTVGKHLSEFAGIQCAREKDGKLETFAPPREPTVQDLLRHTAGLTYEWFAPSLVRQCYSEARIASRDRSNREFSRTLACIPLMHEPGSAWEYSRATDVLGVIVETISGQTLGTFLQERILGPLGMKDTAFSVPAEQQDRIAEPFSSDPDTGEAVRLLDARVVPRMESGGGGLMSTAMDYARFLQMLLNGGQLDGVRLVSRKTIEWMTSDHLDGVPILSDILPAGHGFGLGFAVRLADGVASVAGSAGVYYWGGIAGTSFFVDPTEDLFAILMIQAPGQRDYFRPLFRNMVYAAIDG